MVSGEKILKNSPNGGLVILARSVFISITAGVVVVALMEAIRPGHRWCTSIADARRAFSSNYAVFGTIFAGAYVSLYSRFSSQWAYLAELYNQLMHAQVELAARGPRPKVSDKSKRARGLLEAYKKLDRWKVGFVSDAEDLHLLTKTSFVYIVDGFLHDKYFKEEYTRVTASEQVNPLENDFIKLKSRVRSAIEKNEARMARD